MWRASAGNRLGRICGRRTSHQRRIVRRVVLDFSRQRPYELQSFRRIELDLGNRAESDLIALALDHVLHHRRAVGIARGLRLDLLEHAHLRKQLVEVETGGRGVVNDRIGCQQCLLQRIGGPDLGGCCAIAHDYPGPYAPDRRTRTRDHFPVFRRLLDDRGRHDHDVVDVAGGKPLDDLRRRVVLDFQIVTKIALYEVGERVQPRLDGAAAQYLDLGCDGVYVVSTLPRQHRAWKSRMRVMNRSLFEVN